jgi:hypothetical protein
MLMFACGIWRAATDAATAAAAAAAAAAILCRRVHDGWDLAPLALVPHSSGDLKQLQHLMQLLRDKVEGCKQVRQVLVPAAAAAAVACL